MDTIPKPPEGGSDPGGAPEKIWTPQELAEHFDVSIDTVKRWYLKRGLPFFRTGAGKGGRVRIRDAALQQWIAESEQVLYEDEGGDEDEG